MATKKASKSSKTAHVLNVLSGPKQDLGSEEEVRSVTDEETGGEDNQEAAPARPVVRAPILEMARASDDALSEQIHDLLEEDWTEEIEEPMKIEETVATIEREQVTPEPALPEIKILLDQQEERKEEEPVQKSKEEALFSAEVQNEPKVSLEAPPQPPQEELLADDFCHVNVMQALVDERCMRYIKMFGLCDCSRCIADVKALALSNLPPKYLVMRKGEVIPMLTVYEGRFSTATIAQLITACKVVMDHPRHKKP